MIRIRNVLMTLAVTALVGCNPTGPAIASQVPKEVVERSKALDELVGKVKPAAERGDLAPLFAAGGKVPKNPQDYARYSFSLGQLPMSDGDECKVNVEIEMPNMGDPFDATWTFKRENGEWRLFDAPLPKGSVRREVNTDRD